MDLSKNQLQIVESPSDSSIFLHGPAGTGKTTAGIYRLRNLVETGVPGRKILLYFPQRNLATKYQNSINELQYQGMSIPTSATYGGLARRIIELFWPNILETFDKLDRSLPPTFLTLESTLYFLSTIVEPLIFERGFFSNVAIQRNRLLSQILDNLNKAAVHGFPHTKFSQRLISSWIGDSAQEEIFLQAQESANLFRDFCYSRNLLDYSLQIELFTRALREIPLIFSYLRNQFSHLIYDNSEEDIPVSHDFIKSLMPSLASSLVIYDEGAGYRSFLGASPKSGLSLQGLCQDSVRFTKSFTSSDRLEQFNSLLIKALHGKPLIPPPGNSHGAVFSINYENYYPQMAARVAEKTRSLLNSGVSPGEIVVLAPFLSDTLRFLLEAEFSKQDIPSISHRPSRALRDEPVTGCLLTLAAFAHPTWEIHPSVYELALAFLQVFERIDLTRAYLLAKNALQPKSDSEIKLADFSDFAPSQQERISFYIGSKYQELLNWLHTYSQNPPLSLDHFLSRLFSELLARPNFGFHHDLTKGRIASQIIESFSDFRQSAAAILRLDSLAAGKEYFRLVKTGVLANQYLRAWTEIPADKVLISPAYTFLLNNRASDYQFWLDLGSRGWYERIYQPLTNPYVLHREWPDGAQWSDADEMALNLDTLSCLVTGLVRRCRVEIIGYLTETDERGFEQKGLLLQSLNKLQFIPHSPVRIGDSN